ncbi:regulatory protein, luxR family [Porphyromonadaceae bacterium NLAE-zl-C104]|uniref:helix-turn-helix transcriptional regulator n=1 Tax=Proteiniphilum sp. TaxID=1926877 RepID=UPI0008E6F1A1|nr:helix-turn-helix transcriptional regulator [Proteiniphilum sp.]MDY9919511.1 response regulator transcription factor [Proteiniphilum sp.]SFS41319.1 regulatory protein, luxR family [Porphyromonadaceae bacterium NLAE-zl-C104]
MALLNQYSVMADVLMEHNELIPVLNRFGIRLGVGDKTIVELCDEYTLNPDFILTILNVYLNENYLPEASLALFDAQSIADYFQCTVESYIHELIPNIGKHLNAFIVISGSENEELRILNDIFQKFKEKMTEHLQNQTLFDDDFPYELLHDLKNILIRHLSKEFNQNLIYAIIFSVHSFEKDLAIHNRLRKKVLRPKLNELDSTGIRHLHHAISGDHAQQQPDRHVHQLTNREEEILRLIVKGYLNKEIAEKLHISHNTVLTHRKNIISKTGIKTVSGLTFYAIRKGLISM